MKKFKNLTGLLLFVLLSTQSCKDPKNQKEEEEKEETVATYIKEEDKACLAPSSWFTVDTITGKRKTPAPREDKTSVFGDNTTVSNCDFHQWSWQKFLWLTNDVSGQPLFLEELFQVTSQTVRIPTTNNKIVLTASDKKQATSDILNTNKSFSSNVTSYPVYYSIHVNDSLYNSIWKYAKMKKSDYSNATFPVGSLELKIAWVSADAIPDTTGYFVTDAVVEGKDTKIALLGMHVVGIVYNHPEFVWATFEHHDLAPYYDWKATTTSDVPVTSKTNKLLFDVHATATLANITSNAPNADSTSVFAVNQYGVPRQAGDTFLSTSQEEPLNYDNIAAINTSVKEKLTDVWKNYFYNGSIWINTEGHNYPTEQAKLLVSLGSALSNSAPGKLPRGSVAAYNITMETYEQLGFSPTSIHGQNVEGMGNCFSCHSASRGSSLNISHIFNGAVDYESKISVTQTKQKHLDEIKLFIKNMKASKK
ncbi:hypothetical protein SY27_05930 [Flavobacterium sp. 316]|uniref:hypothetical protein n=1 Tax=Flavobacterium sp. 316 TaxID=1603293 RepID=UPI0005DB9559|nr:hypothetical protein [Flavobacterium sp. 316]KIX22194.1 hypothetical protein SY27_05930 [Flavobacterium sp. 316]